MKLSERQKSWLCLGIIILVTLSVSWPSLLNNFVAVDDKAQLVNNVEYDELSYQTVKKIFSSYTIGMYQPIASLSLALEKSIWGARPVLNHSINLFIHLINACFVFYFIKRLNRSHSTALFTALLFAIHPVQVETVAWTSARSTLLMALFSLLSLISYLKLKEKNQVRHWIFLYAFFILALLTKSSAIVIPALIISLEIFYAGFKLKSLAKFIPLILVSLVFALVAIHGRGYNAAAFDISSYNLFTRLSLVPLALAYYLEKLFLPYNLLIFYAYPTNLNGWISGLYYSVWPLILGLFYLVWQRGTKLLILGSVLIVIFLAPQLPITTYNQVIIADRYMYLAIMGLGLIIFEMVRIIKNLTPRLIIILNVALVSYLIILSVVSWFRYLSWHNYTNLTAEASLQAPNSHLILYHYAYSAYYDKDYLTALATGLRSQELDPHNYLTASLIANIYLTVYEDYGPAIKFYTHAIDYNQETASSRLGRAVAYNNLTEFDKAITDLNLALQETTDPKILNNIYLQRSIALMSSGKHQDACKDLQTLDKIGLTNVKHLLTDLCN